MTLEEQWQNDVKKFDKRAYLMWEYSIDGVDFLDAISNRPDKTSNELISENLANINNVLMFRRKQTATLPFDLVAARAGDIVEYQNIDGEWVDIVAATDFIQRGSVVDVLFNDAAELMFSKNALRMKHPRSVGVDYSEFEKS